MTNNKQQTAVEWLIKIYLQTNKIDNFDIEQAKEMQKEQHKNTWYAGEKDGAIHEFEYYWEETYGGSK
jgi:hypothetical protein